MAKRPPLRTHDVCPTCKRALGNAGPAGVIIPKPPSVNGLFRNLKNRRLGQKGRARTARYVAWHNAAAVAVLAHCKPLQSIAGGYVLRVELGRRKGSDLGNYEKAISDLLVSLGIVRDDSDCESISLLWADDLTSKQARISWAPHVREVRHARGR